MDRKPLDAVELFHACTIAEIRELEADAALVTIGNPYRGENSSSGTPA